MTDINVDEFGPVDYWVVAFPAEQADFSGEMASELKALIDGNTIRVLDLVMVAKDEEGSVEALSCAMPTIARSAIARTRARPRDPARRGGHRGDLCHSGARQRAAVLVWRTLGGAVRETVRGRGVSCSTQRPDSEPSADRAVEADRQDTAKGA